MFFVSLILLNPSENNNSNTVPFSFVIDLSSDKTLPVDNCNIDSKVSENIDTKKQQENKNNVTLRESFPYVFKEDCSFSKEKKKSITIGDLRQLKDEYIVWSHEKTYVFSDSKQHIFKTALSCKQPISIIPKIAFCIIAMDTYWPIIDNTFLNQDHKELIFFPLFCLNLIEESLPKDDRIENLKEFTLEESRRLVPNAQRKFFRYLLEKNLTPYEVNQAFNYMRNNIEIYKKKVVENKGTESLALFESLIAVDVCSFIKEKHTRIITDYNLFYYREIVRKPLKKLSSEEAQIFLMSQILPEKKIFSHLFYTSRAGLYYLKEHNIYLDYLNKRKN